MLSLSFFQPFLFLFWHICCHICCHDCISLEHSQVHFSMYTSTLKHALRERDCNPMIPPNKRGWLDSPQCRENCINCIHFDYQRKEDFLVSFFQRACSCSHPVIKMWQSRGLNCYHIFLKTSSEGKNAASINSIQTSSIFLSLFYSILTIF